MDSNGDILQFDNVFTAEEQAYCIKHTLHSSNWGFANKSDPNYNNHIPGRYSESRFDFWIINLIKDEIFTSTVLERVEQLTGSKYKIHKAVANGQTHGLPGSMHRDSKNPKCKTFLYFVNPTWHIDWGGHLVFDMIDHQLSILPKPNSAVLFDSTIHHMGLEPTRHCPELRVTIAFVLEEIT